MASFKMVDRKFIIRSNLKFIFVLMLFASCNITYKVRNSKNEISDLLRMPCGKLNTELIGRGNSKFILQLHGEFKDSIKINPYAVEIFYNKEAIEYDLQSFNPSKQNIPMLGDHHLSYIFEIKEGVFDGDTILVSAPSYIYCVENVVSLDTIIYAFSNRLRIHGVNYGRE